MHPRTRLAPVFRLLLAGSLVLTASASAQQSRLYASEGEIREALAEALSQGKAARGRAEALEAEASRATAVVEKTAREAAGMAARIQQAQARVAELEARSRLIERQRIDLRDRLAIKQRPLVRLTAALQHLSRRPVVLSLLRPGSLQDTVHLRAVLESVIPEVERRTASLRREIARSRVLQRRAQFAARELRNSEAEMAQRRQQLVSQETRQRLASRNASSDADRETERVLALAEQARDLDSLSDSIGQAGNLRQALADLPGPLLRPARPDQAALPNQAQVRETAAAQIPGVQQARFILPVTGRLVAGFGEVATGVPRSRGIALATRKGAQAIAPAAGRVAFAGPYRGYGQIVIIEHADGWMSLVTGLAQLDTRAGQELVAGSPLGLAGAGRPVISLELRRNGTPVNPLDFIRSI